jgi:hypothetical protein
MDYGAIDAFPNPGYGTGVQDDDILVRKMADVLQNQFGLKPRCRDQLTRLLSQSGTTG